MNDLDRFPSLMAFGRQLDERAERDARRRTVLQRLRPDSHGVAIRLISPTWRMVLAVGLVALTAGGTYAVPATRAAVDDVFGAFADWMASGDSGSAPGRPAAANDPMPAWVVSQRGDKRILARAGGDELVALRQGDKVTLSLEDFATTATTDGWRRTLSGKRIVLVGAGRFASNERHDRRPVFGVVASTIARVQFNYADGRDPVSQSDLRGAFGLVIDSNRRPDSLTGYDARGNEVARVPLITDPSRLTPDTPLADFRYCPDAVTGCPPWPDSDQR